MHPCRVAPGSPVLLWPWVTPGFLGGAAGTGGWCTEDTGELVPPSFPQPSAPEQPWLWLASPGHGQRVVQAGRTPRGL